MKEVFTKSFWQGVKKTFDQAQEGPPPPADKALQTPADGQPSGSSTSATPSSPSVPSGDRSRVLQENEIRLSWDGNQVCVLVGPDLVEGVAGYGGSVHDALRDLADNLVEEGVWIEVTDRTDWDVREKRDDQEGSRY